MTANKPFFAIDVDEGGGRPIYSFQYVFASIRSTYTPERVEFLFVGQESWKVEISVAICVPFLIS